MVTVTKADGVVPAGDDATVVRESCTNLNDGRYRHRVSELLISDIKDEDPEVEIPMGHVGMAREVVSMTPTPIGEHFSVVWNGDHYNPKLRFDFWPGETVRVLVNVWGH